MSDEYRIYEDARNALDGLEHSGPIVELLDELHPHFKLRYERSKKIQESFTPEQIDFICCQIGDWYLDWKERMVTGEGKYHRLGVAKEYLKIKICGE